jgi:metallo-beta-lactamase class B
MMMNRLKPIAAAILLAAIAGVAAAQISPDLVRQRAEWNRPMKPFQIAGNVYYVGTAGLSAFLITDPAGHILIDGAMEESVAQIAANIRSLGFRTGDVKVLLVNHAHWDHSGGLADLKRLTGARLLASAGDRPELESGRSSYRDDLAASAPVKVDGLIRDGARVKVGRTTLVTHLTPGHTKGCTSWTLRSRHQDRPLDILFACSLTVAGQPLVGDRRYPNAAADFRGTFARLKQLRADVFLNFHPEFFDMNSRRRRQSAGEANAFIDPAELPRQIERAEAAFAAELARQKAAAQ